MSTSWSLVCEAIKGSTESVGWSIGQGIEDGQREMDLAAF
jgi:hypothetical protein